MLSFPSLAVSVRVAIYSLKQANVLIDHRGRPRLTDFGLSRMHEDVSLWQTTATTAPGTVRYMAPELLSGAASSISMESDVYAYALTSWVRLPFG
jgi:serine/threonine protein kinase